MDSLVTQKYTQKFASWLHINKNVDTILYPCMYVQIYTHTHTHTSLCMHTHNTHTHTQDHKTNLIPGIQTAIDSLRVARGGDKATRTLGHCHLQTNKQ